LVQSHAPLQGMIFESCSRVPVKGVERVYVFNRERQREEDNSAEKKRLI
jgi:hypothetical protein